MHLESSPAVTTHTPSTPSLTPVRACAAPPGHGVPYSVGLRGDSGGWGSSQGRLPPLHWGRGRGLTLPASWTN